MLRLGDRIALPGHIDAKPNYLVVVTPGDLASSQATVEYERMGGTSEWVTLTDMFVLQSAFGERRYLSGIDTIRQRPRNFAQEGIRRVSTKKSSYARLEDFVEAERTR